MPDLSIRKMAEQLGVSKSQVARDAKAGMPMGTVEAARAWRLSNHDVSRTADGRIDRPAQAPAPNTTPAPERPAAAEDAAAGDVEAEEVDEHTQGYRIDRARNERIKADRAEIELAQLRNELVAVREVEQLQFTAGRIVRDRLEMLAPRAAADLHALVLSLVPEEQRAHVGAGLELHAFERRLADLVREALADASRAIEEARRDDDDPD